MAWKILIWNNAIARFLHSWQDTELVPCIARLLEDEIFGHHMLQNYLKLVSHQWYFSTFMHQTQSSLTYQLPTPFSKEHVISGSYPDNLVCGWEPLDPNPSDPDCLGHPTHFQPCLERARFCPHSFVRSIIVSHQHGHSYIHH